jgi:hypothetical protein
MHAHRCIAALALLLLSHGWAQAQQRQVSVRGSVTDATSGNGVPHVRVHLTDSLTAVTNAHGDFEITRVPLGVYELRLSRIGYRPKSIDVRVAGASGLYVAAVLEALPVELEPVVIRGDTTTIVAYGRMADFFLHRRVGFGRFFTPRDIQQQAVSSIADMLRLVPGLWIRYDAIGRSIVTVRGRCRPAIFVDKIRQPRWASVDDFRPSEIGGVEVYTHFSGMPGQYYDECGAIVLWTR